MRLPHRNLRAVLGEPSVEVEQRRIELARASRIARLQELVAEHRLILEHVAEVLSAGKSEAAEGVEGHVVEIHGLPDRARHLLGHLLTRQLITSDAGVRAYRREAFAEEAVR